MPPVGTWRGMQIETTDSGGTSFEYHQRWMKITQEMDVGLWHPTAFSINSAASCLTARSIAFKPDSDTSSPPRQTGSISSQFVNTAF